MGLVCPECGSDRVGTREQAEIWQGATFTRSEYEKGSFEDASGNEIDADWEAYDSEDVGDTETVGFFCRDCVTTWDGRTCPFILAEDREPKTSEDKEAYIKEYAGLVWNVGTILHDRAAGSVDGPIDQPIWDYLYENLDEVYEKVGPMLDNLEDRIFGEEEE